MKILAITQARIASTRLPEKILKKINDQTLLEIHLKRILKAKNITKLKVATTTEPDAYKIAEIANRLNVEVSFGSVENVLERFFFTAKPENPDWVVRLTSDCPLIDPDEIDKVINKAISNNLDYVSNTLEPTFPDGLDCEIFKFSVLEKAFHNATLQSEIEHVTPYIWKNSTFKGGNLFRSDCVKNDVDLSDIRLTVDTIEDFRMMEALIAKCGTEDSWKNYVEVLNEYPEIYTINKMYSRNEGYIKSIGKDKKI